MSRSGNKPIIGITMGDPQGIGPEVIEKALASRAVRRICRPVVFGDAAYFNFQKAKKLTPKQCGQLSAFYIRQAVQATRWGWSGGEQDLPLTLASVGLGPRERIDAIVTAPISKERLQRAGIPYPGHTEYLAALTGAGPVRMMMTGPRLKVVLVTIHEPIKKVASLITSRNILETIEITDRAMREKFRLKRPRIAVAALNPHAGESGAFGDEEKTRILPAIVAARRKGIAVFGPFAPDTVFLRAVRGEFDAVIAMYHDQGLIPLKLLHFEEAVNMTLGLPILRTSPDHGTAFEIAGRGKADPSSMIAAIETAVALSPRGRGARS